MTDNDIQAAFWLVHFWHHDRKLVAHCPYCRPFLGVQSLIRAITLTEGHDYR